MERQTKTLHGLYAMSKLKFKSYKSFFQVLILLSGDVAMNPGPTNYPCAKCNKGVKKGVLCAACNFWIHQRCEGLNNSELNKLKKIGTLDFICCVCRDKQSTLPPEILKSDDTASPTFSNDSALTEGEHISHLIDLTPLDTENTPFPFNETSLPENEESFQFSAEHLQDISLEDELKVFKEKGLHFVHLNCNSLRSKIEEIRELVLHAKPHVICFSESKLDENVPDAVVKIDDYNILRQDRTSSGGGVACFIHKDVNFDQRTDFPNDFENIFIDIFLPQTKPILFGVVYRPPKDSDFLERLSDSIMNSESFDAQEVIIMGDINIDLLDKKNKFILEKGYRFSKEESNYTHSISLTKKYVAFLRTSGLSQIIKEPTWITDKTATLIDHILINTPDKICLLYTSPSPRDRG